MLLRTLRTLLKSPREGGQPQLGVDELIAAYLREKRLDEAEAMLSSLREDEVGEAQRLAYQAEIKAHRRDHDRAGSLALEALRLQPGLALAHHVLSVVYFASSRIQEALAQAIAAYNSAPHIARICAQLGLCHVKLGHYEHAHKFLTQALLLEPDYPPALNNMAIACHAKGLHEEALYYVSRALAIDPQYLPAIENKNRFSSQDRQSAFGLDAVPTSTEGVAADARELVAHNQESLEAQEVGFLARPGDLSAALALIDHHMRLLNVDGANDVLQIALAHHPGQPDLLARAAHLWVSVGQRGRAEMLYREALQQEPDHLASLVGLARVLKESERYEEALPLLERAAALAPTKSHLLSLCSAQTHACRYPDAVQTMEKLLSLHPDVEPLLYPYRATCNAYMGEFKEARLALERAAQLDPHNLSYQAFDGTLHLLLGDYARGWEGYRLRHIVQPERVRLLPYPLWQGESLTGKEVLILAEQGLGDQIMFASCLPDVLAQHPKAVYLEANARVAKTLARSFPDIQVYASNQQGFDWLPKEAAPDYYLPIADLAWRFRRHREDFPQHCGYLRPDPERVAFWRDRLACLGPQPKVGFTWRGGVQQTRRVIRSLELDTIRPLLELPGIVFVNLQYGKVQEELAEFATCHGLSVVDWPEAIADLDEFAALVSALDLVVTVCNTTVHFAGALGKPCWVMTPFVPEWRYGAQGSTMPWYPSVELVRQRAYGDWESVICALRARLEGFGQAGAGIRHASCLSLSAP